MNDNVTTIKTEVQPAEDQRTAALQHIRDLPEGTDGNASNQFGLPTNHGTAGGSSSKPQKTFKYTPCS